MNGVLRNITSEEKEATSYCVQLRVLVYTSLERMIQIAASSNFYALWKKNYARVIETILWFLSHMHTAEHLFGLELLNSAKKPGKFLFYEIYIRL